MVEHLGEIAADLAVDLDRLHDEVEVLALHPFTHRVQRFAEVAAEPRLHDESAELVRSGRFGLAGNDVEGLHDAVTHAQAPGHQRQRALELRVELRETVFGAAIEVEPGAADCAGSKDESDHRPAEHEAYRQGHDGSGHGEHHEFAGTHVDGGFFERGLQAAAVATALQ